MGGKGSEIGFTMAGTMILFVFIGLGVGKLAGSAAAGGAIGGLVGMIAALVVVHRVYLKPLREEWEKKDLSNLQAQWDDD